MNLLTQIFMVVSGAAALFFVVGYGFAAPWWRSDTGRHFFSFGCLMLAFISLALAATFLGHDWFGRQVVRLFFWGSAAVILIWRNHVFVSAQLKGSLDSGSEDGSRAKSVLGEKRSVGSGEVPSE